MFKRGHGIDAFRNRFALDFHREMIEECVAQEDGRQEELRSAAVAAVESNDPATVVQRLAFLLVAGNKADVPFVEPLTHTRNESVQKAAKTCLFELTRCDEKR